MKICVMPRRRNPHGAKASRPVQLSLASLAAFAIVISFGQAHAFDRKPWQSPLLTEDGTATRIEVGDKPSGLLLRRKLDRNQGYELRVAGTGGPLTMRLMRDLQPPKYLSAPNGEWKQTITATSELEVLFYADSKASYTLQSISIEPCSSCYSSEDVKARVRADVPGIDDMDTFESNRCLRPTIFLA